MTNEHKSTKVNTNAIRTTFFKEFLSLILRIPKLPYAHVLVKKLILQNQLPTVQIAGRLKHFYYKACKVLTRDQSISATAKGYQNPFLSQTNQEKLPQKINFNQKKKEVVTSEIKNLLKKVVL